MTDGRWSEKPIWAFSSGEQKRKYMYTYESDIMVEENVKRHTYLLPTFPLDVHQPYYLPEYPQHLRSRSCQYFPLVGQHLLVFSLLLFHPFQIGFPDPYFPLGPLRVFFNLVASLFHLLANTCCYKSELNYSKRVDGNVSYIIWFYYNYVHTSTVL